MIFQEFSKNSLNNGTPISIFIVLPSVGVFSFVSILDLNVSEFVELAFS